MLFFWTMGNAFSQSDCTKFKTGIFHNIDNGTITTKIERTDSTQIEYHGEKIIKLMVKWIDECSYRLTFLEGNDAWWESRGRNFPTPDLIVRITNINGNFYQAVGKFADNDEFEFTSKIEKIE